MAAGAAYPTGSLLAPVTLAAVHLLTIGWLTLLVFGALHQFVPVIAARSQATGWPALLSLLVIVVGLAGMEAGFLALADLLAPRAIPLLPAGGTLVLAGAALAAAPIARTLWSARPLAFSARFASLGLVFLLATLGLGLTFALALAFSETIQWAAMPTDGLRLHVLSGLLGWFTLTAMGVSYRLLSMFTLAPEERGALGSAVLWLSAGGLAAAWLLGAMEASGLAVPAALSTLAYVALALGGALYLFDMGRMLRARRRPKLELNAAGAIVALAAFSLCLLGAVLATITGRLQEMAGPLGYLFVFGWLSGLGLSQLYKIVPFITWLERYGALLGKQPVPRVQDLVDERRDRPWFVLYFVAVGAGTLCAALGSTLEWRIAIGGHLLATLMIARALWLARSGKPRLVQPRPTAIGGSRSLPTTGS
ncbi:MAG: hypothetical protein IT515_13580 [Burkholderiales bacterium]|nr:hypothetical protein [Burkholderiales bacterium]